MSARADILRLRAQVAGAVLGQDALVDGLLTGLLADGHVLVEGLPGLAKTRAVRVLARSLAVDLARIQFTPDLLPADVTGSEVLDADAQGGFRFRAGPVFAHLVLADEINRAPAKVQSALLEAMEERQVTIAGSSHPLPSPFLVMATQNPIEHEGTYPLPEAQLDRFLLQVRVGYPDEDVEADIIRLVRSEQAGHPSADHETFPVECILAARREVDAIAVSPALDRYLVDLVLATRRPERADPALAGRVALGASPRGGIALDRAARVQAWLAGRDHVLPEDVARVAPSVLRHRIALGWEALSEGITADDVIARLVECVVAP